MANKSSIQDILVVGAGAIGGVTAAILSKNNVDVTTITRKGPHYEAIKKEGLIINGYSKPFKLTIFDDFKEIKSKFKHILIAVKNIDTEAVAKQLDPFLTSETLIYSLQNGFGNTELLAKYLPREQIVAGVVGWGATYLGEGKISITSTSGDFIFGFESGLGAEDLRLLDIKKKLEYWKPTILTNNILGYRWSKLIVNSVIAPLGGLFGITVGQMLRNPEIQEIMCALKEEGIQVGRALKLKLEKVDGMNIQYFFYKAEKEDAFFTRLSSNIISKIILKVGSKRHGKIYPSLLMDLQRGKQTEIDFLNGYIEMKGKEFGIETPMNSYLVKAIKEIEKGKRTIGIENIAELKQVLE